MAEGAKRFGVFWVLFILRSQYEKTVIVTAQPVDKEDECRSYNTQLTATPIAVEAT